MTNARVKPKRMVSGMVRCLFLGVWLLGESRSNRNMAIADPIESGPTAKYKWPNKLNSNMLDSSTQMEAIKEPKRAIGGNRNLQGVWYQASPRCSTGSFVYCPVLIW